MITEKRKARTGEEIVITSPANHFYQYNKGDIFSVIGTNVTVNINSTLRKDAILVFNPKSVWCDSHVLDSEYEVILEKGESPS